MRSAKRLALLLLAHVVAGIAPLEFPLHDSNDRPTEFKDGLPTYVKVTMDNSQGQDMELFLLCTTCTISYIFGKPDDFGSMEPNGVETMVFKEGGGEVQVEFYTVTLTLTSVNTTDNSETPYSWEMSIGYISPEYQSAGYFDHFRENMLGLAPMITDDEELYKRQFLYQFTQGEEQKKLGLMESYGFHGGEFFSIGGNVTDYQQLKRFDGSNDGFDWKNLGELKEGVIPDGYNEMNFAPPLVYFEGKALMEKVSNYIPPIKQELESQGLVVDTWSRSTTLPSFFWRFFMQTFMVPAYTCDKMEPKDLQYPGMEGTYSCFCNNGDYHTMPSLNFEITDENYQFNLDPNQYMYLPYLNYTQPMSLCVLGLEESTNTLPDGTEYVGLGQRAMATFPFYAVFDRETNRVAMELGNAQDLGGEKEMGLQLAASAVIVIGLLVLLGYLIYLRKSRI